MTSLRTMSPHSLLCFGLRRSLITIGAVSMLLTCVVSSPAASGYGPEAGYGPFDKQVHENRLIVANVGFQLELLPNLLVAVASSESGFSRKAKSAKGAIGIMQVMPPTARETAGDIGLDKFNLEDPFQNALIGGLYLKKMLARYGGDVHLALAAYNAGPTTVDEWIAASPKRSSGADIVKRRACRETRGYVHEVIRQAGVGPVIPQKTGSLISSTNGPVARYACLATKDDTFCSIARRYGIGIKDLWQLNAGTLNAAGDGMIVSPGQPVWLRPLPPGLAVPSVGRRELPASQVEISVNKAGGYLDVSVSGTLLRRFQTGRSGSFAGPKTSAWDGRCPEGEYYICGKTPLIPRPQLLQFSYPNENDAWNALLEQRISAEEFEAIAASLATGDAPPWNRELGGNVCIRGSSNGTDWNDGCIVLDDGDADELFALTPNGARVVISAGD